jgi:hypothetical protein
MLALRAIVGLTRTAVFLVGVVVVAGAPTLAWVWVGSQVQGGTTPTASAIVTVVGGLVVTYLLLALLFAWIAGRSQSRPEKRVRYAWNRSLRDERHQVRRGHWLEDLFVAAAILVGIVILVWFFLWGNPGVPVAP